LLNYSYLFQKKSCIRLNLWVLQDIIHQLNLGFFTFGSHKIHCKHFYLYTLTKTNRLRRFHKHCWLLRIFFYISTSSSLNLLLFFYPIISEIMASSNHCRRKPIFSTLVFDTLHQLYHTFSKCFIRAFVSLLWKNFHLLEIVIIYMNCKDFSITSSGVTFIQCFLLICF